MSEEPTDLELLILPYLAGELEGEDRMVVERQIADNASFARLVEEFRVTVSFFEMDADESADDYLEDLEDNIYREIASVAAQSKRLSPAPLQRTLRITNHLAETWKVWTGVGAFTAACLMFGAALALKPEPVDTTAFIAGNFVTPLYNVPTRSHHETFRVNEHNRLIEEAQLLQYGRGEIESAMVMYEQVLSKDPDSWASRVAESERSALMRTAVTSTGATFRPLFADATTP